MWTISPEGASSFSFFFLKLGERIQTFKVLGCYSADKAAQPTANSNFITNELSLFSQKDRNPICFFMYIVVRVPNSICIYMYTHTYIYIHTNIAKYI